MAAMIRSIPTVRDNGSDLIGLWVCPHLTVECLHVTTLFTYWNRLFSREHVSENTYWLFTCSYSFLHWFKASMYLNPYTCAFMSILDISSHVFMMIGKLDLYNSIIDDCLCSHTYSMFSWICWHIDGFIGSLALVCYHYHSCIDPVEPHC
jgi:hypothetical protein